MCDIISDPIIELNEEQFIKLFRVLKGIFHNVTETIHQFVHSQLF